MEPPLARAALDFYRRRSRWLLLLAAAGASGYCAYRAYHLPAVAERRRRLARLLRALVSVADAVSASAEAAALVSGDLHRFLRSEEEELPASLRRIAKIAASDEIATSVSRVAEAVTVGVLRGVAASESGSRRKQEEGGTGGSGFTGRVMDKLFSPAGSGFASVVVGSFSRNMVMALYSAQGEVSTGTASDGGRGVTESAAYPVPAWVHVICGDKFRQLIGDCIQLFVSTAVAVYLDKTMHINTYDEIFSGLTNPKHEDKVKDVLVSVCSGAMETLVKTSHKVLTNTASSSSSWTDREEDAEVEEVPTKHIRRASLDLGPRDGGSGWVDKVSSTLSVPSNRRLVLDLTGRVTFETVRSFLDFVLRQLFQSARTGAEVVRGEVIEKGLEVVRYAAAKSMVILTVCLALFLHLLSGARFVVPA